MKKQHQGVEKASSSTVVSSIQMVFISNIVIEPSFQSTNRNDQSVKNEYEGKYELGIDMTPIRLAEVNGLLILIDGYHRLEAQKALGWYEVEAEVTPMTMEEAYMEAIKANTNHGLRLTPKQKKEKLERLYTMKWYKDDNGRPRKFEDMARDINGAINYRFISNWMKRKHPKTYYWMKGGKKDPKYKRGGGLREKQIPIEEDAGEHLKRAELAFYNDNDPFGRETTISAVKEMLARMNKFLGRDDDLEF